MGDETPAPPLRGNAVQLPDPSTTKHTSSIDDYDSCVSGKKWRLRWAPSPYVTAMTSDVVTVGRDKENKTKHLESMRRRIRMYKDGLEYRAADETLPGLRF